MKRYAGTCKGGPRDGERLVHDQRSYRIMVPAIVTPGEGVLRVKEGEYRFDETTPWPYWKWVPPARPSRPR